MTRNASAVWTGDLRAGAGRLSTESGALAAKPYSFRTRFEGETGTNPEELIAAAHASCFAMATAAQLGERGITPERVEASAAVTMENLTVTRSALTLRVVAKGSDEAKLSEAAEAAKSGCPISKVLNAEITLDATYEV